jgi:hypothetical protein
MNSDKLLINVHQELPQYQNELRENVKSFTLSLRL